MQKDETEAESVSRVTGLREREYRQLLRWWQRLPLADQIAIFGQGVRQSFQVAAEHPGIPGRVGKFCGLIIAVQAARRKIRAGGGQEPARVVPVPAAGKPKAIPPLRRKVLAYLGEIQELRAKGQTFREIARHLRTKRRLKVTHSYLYRIFKEEVEAGKTE